MMHACFLVGCAKIATGRAGHVGFKRFDHARCNSGLHFSWASILASIALPMGLGGGGLGLRAGIDDACVFSGLLCENCNGVSRRD